MAFGFGKKKKKLDEGLDEDFDEELDLPPLPGLPEDDELPELPSGDEIEGELPELEGELPPMTRAPMGAPEPARQASAAEVGRAPVFIKIDKYKDLMKTVQSMQSKIDELQDTLDKVSSIKSKEREIIDGIGSLLTDARGKATEVSSKLLKPEA